MPTKKAKKPVKKKNYTQAFRCIYETSYSQRCIS